MARLPGEKWLSFPLYLSEVNVLIKPQWYGKAKMSYLGPCLGNGSMTGYPFSTMFFSLDNAPRMYQPSMSMKAETTDVSFFFSTDYLTMTALHKCQADSD